ncbi:unnamed protein product [Owenia fusiformis]|uniref:Uncharacterized protein n=1 Tax=Owenia fusiformis TaxID=6347 RepID=A0A8S4NMC7_OWEFU|nr:unnamed protein product [Owenia fusiformis]
MANILLQDLAKPIADVLADISSLPKDCIIQQLIECGSIEEILDARKEAFNSSLNRLIDFFNGEDYNFKTELKLINRKNGPNQLKLLVNDLYELFAFASNLLDEMPTGPLAPIKDKPLNNALKTIVLAVEKTLKERVLFLN